MTDRYYVPTLNGGSTVTLPPEEARHAATVMRVATGESIVVFDGCGAEALAEVVSVTRKSVQCVLLSPLQIVDRERTPEVHLAVALPKGDRQRVLVEKLVELGAASLTPIIAQRSVAKPDAATLERLQRGVIEASKQCGRNRLMEIRLPCDLVQYLRDSGGFQGEKWIANPCKESRDMHQSGVSRWGLIGPEGGFTPDEIARAEQADWQALSLGPRVLRTETAAIAFLART